MSQSQDKNTQFERFVSDTVQYYEDNAERFWLGTRDHDVSQNYHALLDAIVNPSPLRILDLGCGPGRDLHYFRSLGHEAIGLDASSRFAELARAHSGCEVWVKDFREMALPDEHFDGVFANASLFHVPKDDILGVLKALNRCLAPGAVLFCSMPRGNDEEGFTGGRFGVYYRDKTWLEMVPAAGFVEIRHYYRPEGLSREKQPWLASVWRKA
jgi:SAM-dependent methyltransferase